MRLAGFRAAVTGGSSGIGLAIARTLAAEGAAVASFARRFPDIAELKQRVRDHIDPQRDLGHVDRAHPKQQGE